MVDRTDAIAKAGAHRTTSRRTFDALDLDGNGEVSFEEFFSLSLREGPPIFAASIRVAPFTARRSCVVLKNALLVAGADPTSFMTRRGAARS